MVAGILTAAARFSVASGPVAPAAIEEDGDIDPAVPFPVPLDAKLPLGSLIYDPAVSGTLAAIVDADDFESGALGPRWSTASSTASATFWVASAAASAAASPVVLEEAAAAAAPPSSACEMAIRASATSRNNLKTE